MATPWGGGQNAAQSLDNQGFFIDESGNVQRQNRRGELGLRHFWKGRPELGAGNPVDYDWRKINRPDILEGQREMFQRKTTSRGRATRSAPANVREPEPYGTGRFKNRQATPQQETPVNDPRSHKLTRVRVTGMDTVAGEMGGERRGALPRASQFNGTYIEPETAVGGTSIRGAIGPGPRALHPGAIETTAVSEHGSGKRKGQTYWEF